MNDVIGPPTPCNNDVQHNALWLRYGCVAAAFYVVTKGRLGCRIAA